LGFRQIAYVNTDTGELREQRPEDKEEAEQFYQDLRSQGVRVRVGMEASGHARWCEQNDAGGTPPSFITLGLTTQAYICFVGRFRRAFPLLARSPATAAPPRYEPQLFTPAQTDSGFGDRRSPSAIFFLSPPKLTSASLVFVQVAAPDDRQLRLTSTPPTFPNRA
jgi:hypothetical protein